MEFFEILCVIAVVILALYYFLTWTFDFWTSRDIRGPRPIPGFGNFKDVIFGKISVGDYLAEVYNDYKDEPLIGIFVWTTPVLILRDLDIIKDVFIKDFFVFANRGLPTYEKAEPLTQGLFHLEQQKWRPLRMKLSPIFTSGKLKRMISLMSECADHFVEYLEKIANENEPVECRELTAKYTTDVIGSCVFGIEMNALSNEDSEFRIMGKKVFNPNKLRRNFREFLPGLYNMLGPILPQLDITEFFIRIIVETIDYREINNITRNDFVDALRELKKHPDKLGDISLTDSFLASQAFIFFIAGFESASSTITHALYELAINQKIQDKLREEIDEVYAKYDGALSYNNIKEMNYLNKVFKETLRKYPPATFIMRQSTSSYTFDGTRVNIPKNQNVWIPIYAIHRNAEIYPEPDTFDPERFSQNAVQNRHPMAYLPFGVGPRNCVAARFAVYQTEIGLVKILRNYKVETCEKTPIPYINHPSAFVLSPKSGIYLKIIKINH